MTCEYCCCSLNWIQGVIVSAAVFGAALGAALGGALGDQFGRKTMLLVGDALFAVGAVLMAAAQGVGSLIGGAECLAWIVALCMWRLAWIFQPGTCN